MPAKRTTRQGATLMVAASASVAVTGRDACRRLAAVSARDELMGNADAARTGIVTPGKLNGHARRRPAEAREAVPGLVVSQHSGEGKAGQSSTSFSNSTYFLDDPVSGETVDRVDPLVRASGAESGVRTLALPRLHTTLAVCGLWLDSELIYIGDAGTTEASRPSPRRH